jgi:hypothetical protein
MGRRSNQPRVGVRDGEVLREDARPRWSAWGDVVPSFGATIGATKKIEGHGAMALGGRNFIRRNNNQLTVGVRGWVEMGEEALPRWRAWGGVVPSFGATN